jgi:predicted dehydrogenase
VFLKGLTIAQRAIELRGVAGKTKPIRIGIIGCGSVLSAYISSIERLRAKGMAEVVAACGRPDQRQFVCDELGISNFATEHDAVIGSEEVDLVLILTSMKEHGRLARAALEAGKHVLVEKPMAVNLDEAAQLVEVARRSRGYLVCAPFTILSPTFQTISQRIRRGDVGKVCSARGRYGWAGPSWGKWFYRPGGGALFDLGVYNITSLTGLLGPARRVTAMTGIAIPEREINGERIRVEAEDNTQVLMDFGESVFAVVTSGFTIQQYRSPGLELYGTKGTVQMMGDDWDPDGYELWQNDAGAWQIFKETDPDWPWTDGLSHLVDCVQKGVSPLVTPEHAFHVLEIMIKAQASGSDGQAKQIESSFTQPVFEAVTRSEPAHLIHDRTRKHDVVP